MIFHEMSLPIYEKKKLSEKTTIAFIYITSFFSFTYIALDILFNQNILFKCYLYILLL